MADIGIKSLRDVGNCGRPGSFRQMAECARRGYHCLDIRGAGADAIMWEWEVGQ